MKHVVLLLALVVVAGLLVAGCQKAAEPPAGGGPAVKAPPVTQPKAPAAKPEAAKGAESGMAGSESAPVAKGEGIAWEKSYDAALEKARAEKKLVFVDFKASWCGPCKKLEAEAYPKPEVQAKLANVICVMVDVDENPDLASQFSVSGVPYLIVVDADGNKVADQTGYESPAGLVAFLDKALAKKS